MNERDDDWKDIRPFLPPVGERLVLLGPAPASIINPGISSIGDQRLSKHAGLPADADAQAETGAKAGLQPLQ